MELISSILPYTQIVLSVLLVGSVLLQQTGSSLGGAFGGDNFAAGFHTRRGAEKFLFQATIVIAVLFVLSTFTALFLDAGAGRSQPVLDIEPIDTEQTVMEPATEDATESEPAAHNQPGMMQ